VRVVAPRFWGDAACDAGRCASSYRAEACSPCQFACCGPLSTSLNGTTNPLDFLSGFSRKAEVHLIMFELKMVRLLLGEIMTRLALVIDFLLLIWFSASSSTLALH